MIHLELLVEPVRKELHQRVAAEPDPVDIVRPVYQQAAPDHHHQDWKVDPMEPTDRQRVLLLEPLDRRDCGHVRLRPYFSSSRVWMRFAIFSSPPARFQSNSPVQRNLAWPRLSIR